MSYEEWIRCKDHQQSLREVLILEAKRDLYEKFLRMQAELDERNQERQRQMYEWEDKKLVQEALAKEMELRKKEKERLAKNITKEKSYGAFKEWLKQSLIREREEQFHKKLANSEKGAEEQAKTQEKEHKKVMSKIAYREWKERKLEEARHQRK